MNAVTSNAPLIMKLPSGAHYQSDRPETVPGWRDIAAGLSRINRWNGATFMPYSVAQHCCEVAGLLWTTHHDPALTLYGLLHDAPECVTGDIPSPVKQILGDNALASLNAIDRSILSVLCSRLTLPIPTQAQGLLVHEADLMVLMAERRDLTLVGDVDLLPVWPNVKPMRRTVRAVGAEKAELDWLAQLETYATMVGATVDEEAANV